MTATMTVSCPPGGEELGRVQASDIRHSFCFFLYLLMVFLLACFRISRIRIHEICLPPTGLAGSSLPAQPFSLPTWEVGRKRI